MQARCQRSNQPIDTTMKATYNCWRKLLALALCLVLSAGCTKASKVQRILQAADADFQAQKYDKAEDEYVSVFRLAPRNPVALRQLGFIYFEQGRAGALILLKMANKEDKKNAQVQLKLAQLYGESKMPKEAVDLLESFLQTDPGNEIA